jgi:dTDP-D-glucose 4,6-dehydratase
VSATLLVTGGAGFIGSNFVHLVLRERRTGSWSTSTC